MKYANCILAFVLVLFASAFCFAQDQVKLNPEQTRIIEKGDEDGEWYETMEVMGSDGKYHEVSRKNLNAQAESKTAPKPDVASQKPETKPAQTEVEAITTSTTIVAPSVTANTEAVAEEVPTMTNADVQTTAPIVSSPVIIAGQTSATKQAKNVEGTDQVIAQPVSPVVSKPETRTAEILSELQQLSRSIVVISEDINRAIARDSKQEEIVARQKTIETQQAEIRAKQDQILQKLNERSQTTYRSNPLYLAYSFIYGLLMGLCLAFLTVLYMMGELGNLFKRKRKDKKKEDDDDNDDDIGEPNLEELEWNEMKRDMRSDDEEVTRPRGEFDHYYEVADPENYPDNEDGTAVTLTDSDDATSYNKKLFELKIHEPALHSVQLIVLGGSEPAAKQLYSCLISILVRNVPPVELYGLKKIFVGFPLGSHASEDGTEVYLSEDTTSDEMAIGLEQARKQRVRFAEQNKPEKAPDHMRPSDIGNPGL